MLQCVSKHVLLHSLDSSFRYLWLKTASNGPEKSGAVMLTWGVASFETAIERLCLPTKYPRTGISLSQAEVCIKAKPQPVIPLNGLPWFASVSLSLFPKTHSHFGLLGCVSFFGSASPET